MNEIQKGRGSVMPFPFDGGHTVRAMDRDNEPWFVAKDVCDILGLGNITEALRNLDDDERNYFRISEVNTRERGNPDMIIINESGLYNLIFRSNKPEARAFRKWVTAEVLPEIRRRGHYTISKELDAKIETMVKREMRLIEPNFEIKQLQNFLLMRLIITGTKSDIIEFHSLYFEYEQHVEIKLEKDAFISAMCSLYPGIKINRKGCYFSGCRFHYGDDRKIR